MADLRETFAFDYKITLDEGEENNRWLIVEGVSQRADKINANRRIYPRHVLESAITNPTFVENLGARGVLGEVDHPDDGKSRLKQVSHIVLEAKMLPNGDVWSKFLILNTPQGEILKECFRAGARVGISSRGSGSVKPGSGSNSGASIVQEDYRLSTWDFVIQPSTFGAYPTPTNESKPMLLTNEGTEATDNPDATFLGQDPPKTATANAAPPASSIPSTSNVGVPSEKDAKEVDAEGHPKAGTLGHEINTLPQAPKTPGGPTEPATQSCDCGYCAKNENEDEPKPMKTNENSQDKRVVESLIRQNRLSERIASADRAASAKLFGALITKIRSLASDPGTSAPVETPAPVNTTAMEAEITNLRNALAETKGQLQAVVTENSELKKFVTSVKAKLAEAEDSDDEADPQVAGYVKALAEKDADASDWSDYLSEAATIDEAKARYQKIKGVVVERIGGDLPRPGAKSTLSESKAIEPLDESVRLARKAVRNMGRTSRHLGQKTNGMR